MSKNVKRIIALLVGISIVGIGFYVNSIKNYRLDINELEKSQKELSKELEKLKKEKNVDSKEVKLEFDAVKTLGDKVAELQNKYEGLSLDDVEKNSEELSKYFTEDSDRGRTPWYSTVNNADVKSSWKFDTTFGLSLGNFDVIWTHYDSESKKLLAYTKAKYDVKEKKFKEVEVRQTSFGQASVSTEGDNR